MASLDEKAGLPGKNAVVIGGAYGIGRAITLALAGSGIRIAVCDNDEEALAKIGPEVEALGQRVLALPADVRDPDALDRFYDRVEQEFDHIDILVNVPGGVRRKPLLETSRKENEATIRLNYGYVIDSFLRAIPLIRKSGKGGSIINFTTIEGYRGAATFSVYSGAKAATSNFSRCMAVELAAEGIRVNVIAPDTTPSRTSNSGPAPEDLAKLMSLPAEVASKGMELYIPQKKPPSEEDLANAVLFLASDLSKSITGVTLHVDGGTMAAAGFIDWPHGDGWMPAPMAGSLNRLFG